MKSTFPANPTQDSIFTWLLHRISEEFGKSAILKGGMSLCLLNSSRITNDLDFIFVPYKSRKQIVPTLETIIQEIPNVRSTTSINSKALRILFTVENITLQIEANVAKECKSIAVSTETIARKVNMIPRTISIMDPRVALAHKIAAWNERRLMRDLYDIYFMITGLNLKPDMETLYDRLSKIQSRLPALKNKKKMTLEKLGQELQKASMKITTKNVVDELSPILPKDEIAGMDLKIKTALLKLLEMFNSQKKH